MVILILHQFVIHDPILPIMRIHMQIPTLDVTFHKPDLVNQGIHKSIASGKIMVKLFHKFYASSVKSYMTIILAPEETLIYARDLNAMAIMNGILAFDNVHFD